MNLIRIFVPCLFIFALALFPVSKSMAQCNAKFTASSITGKTNDEVVVKYTVDNFTEIASLQWTIKFDKAVLQYLDIVDLDLPDLTKSSSFNVTKASEGQITVTWNYQQGATKPNGAAIFGIKFKLIGADGKTSAVSFSNTPLKFEIGDKDGNECKLATSVPGKVDIGTVVQPPVGVAIKAGTASASKEQEVCIPVAVSGFKSVTAMQFSMGWDTSKIKFVKLQKFAGFTNFDAGNFGTVLAPGGKISSVWFDPNTTGQTVADGVAIFEICFRYTGTCPSTAAAAINFTDDPTRLDVVTTGGKLVVAKESGSITCAAGTSLAVSSTKVTHPCPGQTNGAIEITASGGTGTLTYLWSNGATTKDVSNLGTGTYNVTVKDGANNTITLSSAIVLTTLTATPQGTDPTGGLSNGSIVLTVAGGNNPLTYLWSNNATLKDINNLPAGAYTYTVTDASNCKATGTVNLGGATVALDITNIVPAGPGCSGQSTGTISVTIVGGRSPDTYAWTGPSGFVSTAEDISALAVGTYKLTVKDAANATKVSADIVLVAGSGTPLSLTIRKKEPSSLNNDGEISASPVGGTAPVTYRWNTGSTSCCLTSLPKGNYNVTATDARGCTATTNVTLTGSSSACFTSIRAFTPNGDGLNELFIINCADVNSTQLSIYNRWNQLVYTANNYRNDWNGIDNKGLLLPDGTYYWILRNNSDNTLHKGHVALIRSLN